MKTQPKVWNLWEHQNGWGHHVDFFDWENRRIQGFHPNPWLWRVGDEVRAKMHSGKIARFRITNFHKPHDPRDQFFLTVEDIGYLEKSADVAPTA